ncbi:hypothetical protein HU200_048103 [Digitaria exilis]|uniref:Glyceraldehyde 3-phosphate dehydrogenase NAD(P) binding domain-containing protein n=1 Tax=Digitaria exilis TaxID=1010633 RepID=A0A835E9H6_9POAL|nr:hypothetical protein HU200_048103 [Digitaria exilis]
MAATPKSEPERRRALRRGQARLMVAVDDLMDLLIGGPLLSLSLSLSALATEVHRSRQCSAATGESEEELARPLASPRRGSGRDEDQDEHSFTLLKLEGSIGFPPLAVGEKLLLEGHGLRCNCSVYSLPETRVEKLKTKEEDGLSEEKSDQKEDEGVLVAVQDCQIRPCSACASLELPMPDPLLPDGLKDKTVRFCRLGLQNIEVTEARVTEVEGRRPSLSIVRLDIRAASPPAFCSGELLVLESLDGLRHWEANMRSDDQWAAYGRSDLDAKFYDSGNSNRSISVHVRTAEANSDHGLLLQKSMMIVVKHLPDSSYPLTDNAKGAALRKAGKATVSETHIAKTKIKIGIDGFGSTGRAMARIALESKDVELVVVNDSAITMDQMTCMFRDTHECGQWLSNFKIKDEDPNILMFGDKEVAILRIKYGNHVVIIMFNIVYPREPDKIPWSKTRADYIVTACADESDADYYKAIGSVLPGWKGACEGMIFRVPAVDELPMDLAIELAEFKEYQLLSCSTK